MNTTMRLGGFALALVVVFGAAYGVGQVTGPIATAETSHDASGHGTGDNHGDGGHDERHDGGHDGGGHHDGGGDHLPGGLLVSDRGFTLVTVPAAPGEFAFQILDANGRPATQFDVQHDKRMHLIVARRDLSNFRHVHPEMGPDGTWRVGSPLGEPGPYRVFADFKPTGGEPLTLGIDVDAAGTYAPRPVPAASTVTTVDGYTVTLTGTLKPGANSKLTLSVSRACVPVTDLQPYLGAYGHLVALRSGDMAYLHVHPDGEPGDGKTASGPDITFYATAPSVGTYRLYLDFKHGDVVRTAEFTVVAGASEDAAPSGNAPAPGSTPTPPSGPASPSPTGHDHGPGGHGH